jgi:hypothetical protein
MTMVCLKCYFFHIIRVHTNLVVAGPKIKFCEESGAMELVEKLFDHRDGEFILNCALVEGTVIHAESPCLVWFLDEQHRRGEG